MEVPNHIVCDVCGRAKGETNHWIVAVTSPRHAGIMFVPSTCVDEPRSSEATYHDICGHDCAHKRLSRWLETPWL